MFATIHQLCCMELSESVNALYFREQSQQQNHGVPNGEIPLSRILLTIFCLLFKYQSNKALSIYCQTSGKYNKLQEQY